MYQSYWHDFLPWINTFWFNFAILSDSIIISLYSEGIKMNKLIQARITGCGDIKKKKKNTFWFQIFAKKFGELRKPFTQLRSMAYVKKMVCYATHLGLWGESKKIVEIYSSLFPLPPLFSPDLANKHAHLPCMLAGMRQSWGLAVRARQQFLTLPSPNEWHIINVWALTFK